MDAVWTLVHYLRDHPGAALGLALALGLVYYLLNRKTKLVREADERFAQLQKRRGDHYNQLRPQG